MAGCFREPKMALCGNGVVEEGEECDCGWEEDCEEQCCWPQRTEFGEDEKPCTLRPGKACSPTQVCMYPSYRVSHLLVDWVLQGGPCGRGID